MNMHVSISPVTVLQLTTSSSSGSEVVDVSVIWSGPGVHPPHAIDTLNDSSGKLLLRMNP